LLSSSPKLSASVAMPMVRISKNNRMSQSSLLDPANNSSSFVFKTASLGNGIIGAIDLYLNKTIKGE
jgi:hypothetical protein